MEIIDLHKALMNGQWPIVAFHNDNIIERSKFCDDYKEATNVEIMLTKVASNAYEITIKQL